jgi:DNA-binding response OmpR family regulator
MSPKKILLVDDSKTMLLMEQEVLGSGGYQLITARDGEAAIRAALTHAPDLILLDALLPKMDGLEVCRQLRGKDQTRGTPIILMTPRSGDQGRDESFRKAANDTVTKPINGLELLAKIKNLLGD